MSTPSGHGGPPWADPRFASPQRPRSLLRHSLSMSVGMLVVLLPLLPVFFPIFDDDEESAPTGRFQGPIDACFLVRPATVRQLAPKLRPAPEYRDSDSGRSGCEWKPSNPEPGEDEDGEYTLSIDTEFFAGDSEPGPQRAWEELSKPQPDAVPVRRLGAQAYRWSTGGQPRTTEVMFRMSNVIVTVHYGAPSERQARTGAMTLAKQAAARLR